MSRKAMQVALEALESDPISHAGPVTVLSPGKGTGCGYTNINENWTPVYTAPPKREWVGLTDGEIDILSCEMVKGYKSVNWLCKVLEAKLKEKNHG